MLCKAAKEIKTFLNSMVVKQTWLATGTNNQGHMRCKGWWGVLYILGDKWSSSHNNTQASSYLQPAALGIWPNHSYAEI